ncbi:MAG: hypothetical protein ACRC1H_06820, partial [Caldilineaceae bacterium]
GAVVIDAAHDFVPGLMARTVFIPAGTCLVGLAHREDHLNFCSGDITVWTEAGMRRITGFAVVPSRAGAQRVGYAHADTWWSSVHANADDCRDMAQLERRLVEQPQQLQQHRLQALGG